MPVVPDGAVRTHPLLSLPPLLATFGLSLSDLLDEAGLPQDLLADTENTVQLVDAARLLALCATRTGCPHFGLSAAQLVSFEEMGPIGLLAQWAGSVGSALRGLILNLHLHDRAIIPALFAVNGTAMLSLAPHRYIAVGADQVADFTLAVTFNLMQGLCGPAWRPSEVRIARRPPTDRRPYDRLFGPCAVFGSDRNALVFSESWLAHRLDAGRGVSRRQLEHVVAEALRRLELDPLSRARRAVMMSLMGEEVSVRSVACLVSMHPRSLNRHLAARGTTCRHLIKEVRDQIACQLLSDTDLPMAEIAESLAYSDETSFVRAFRHRIGTSPSAWRRDQGRNGPWPAD
jgi:AraC-like DNA-binding protein